MEFLDYEKIIRDNYPILIESYVRQYGEEKREHISSVLERAKYCFYVTPVNIVEYVNRKTNENYIKAILDSYVELGLDISGITIGEDSLEFNNSRIGNLSLALFPALVDLNNLEKRGIFTFNSDYDFLDVNDPITTERMILLEKLNLKDKNIPNSEYYNGYRYKSNCLFMRQFLNVIKRNIDSRKENFDDLLSYASELEKKVTSIGRHYEKEFLVSIKDFLCEDDRVLIESGKDFNCRDLKDYSLYFDEVLAEHGFSFSDGPIDFFLDIYTDTLLDKEASEKEKQEVIKMRFLYLEKVGFDTSKLNINDLYCDWYEIDELRDFLPSKERLDCISEHKDLFYNKFEYKAASACIINDYELDQDDALIYTIMDECGHSCSIYHRDEDFDLDNFSSTICLCPLMDDYNLFDIAIDHELRHAIETTIKVRGKKLIIKVGCDISKYDFNFDNGVSEFTDLNERITHKLSVEATRERWERGEFIFSDKYALIYSYPSSVYDYDFDNLAIILEPFKKKIIDAQISSDANKIYGTIPKQDLRKIDELITVHDEKTTRKLKAISRRLLRYDLTKADNDVKIKGKGAKNE